jgi:hypothetical protein
MKSETLTKTENVTVHSIAEELQIWELYSHSYFPFNPKDITGSKNTF